MGSKVLLFLGAFSVPGVGCGHSVWFSSFDQQRWCLCRAGHSGDRLAPSWVSALCQAHSELVWVRDACPHPIRCVHGSCTKGHGAGAELGAAPGPVGSGGHEAPQRGSGTESLLWDSSSLWYLSSLPCLHPREPKPAALV